MGRDIYIDRIVLTEQEFKEWQNGMYLHFDAGLVDFETACEASGVQMKEHYLTEDEYNDDLYEVEHEIYWNGHFLYDDRYGFESDNCDCIAEWDTFKVDDKYVVIRVVYQ